MRIFIIILKFCFQIITKWIASSTLKNANDKNVKNFPTFASRVFSLQFLLREEKRQVSIEW